jgi:hypothetical protein
MSRYAGKPFLRLLECYVLDAIGELSDEQQATLLAPVPRSTLKISRSTLWTPISLKDPQ